MPKPRVFISHSARGEPETLALLDDLREALQDEFAVLIDKDDLKPGDPWRQTLNTWIGGCDVAIVLLTEKALQSDYVAYEVTILTYREANLRDSKCKLIPVFIDPVNDGRVRQARGFGPSQIAEVQAIVCGKHADTNSRAEIVDKVKSSLIGFVRVKSPIEAQETWIEHLLEDVPERTVTDALDKLGVDLGGWKIEPRRSLALALLSRGLNNVAVRVILDLRPYIEDNKGLESLFETVATSWIDLRSTLCLQRIAKNKQERVAMLNAATDFVALKYVERAINPGKIWFAPVTAIFSEEATASLHDEIDRSLKQALGLVENEDLKESLETSDELEESIFVSMSGAGINKEILGRLREDFPGVTFLLLAGHDTAVLNALEQQNIELLEPRLTEDFKEVEFIDTYTRYRFNVVVRYRRLLLAPKDVGPTPP